MGRPRLCGAWFVYERIAEEPGDFAILPIPLGWRESFGTLGAEQTQIQYYQTVHGKRLLTAYTSRDNPLELAWRTPVLQQWRALGPDIIDQPLNLIAPTIFYDFNLRYIVLDELHTYRGVFGSHLANVLRRLRRIARFRSYTAARRVRMAWATWSGANTPFSLPSR